MASSLSRKSWLSAEEHIQEIKGNVSVLRQQGVMGKPLGLLWLRNAQHLAHWGVMDLYPVSTTPDTGHIIRTLHKVGSRCRVQICSDVMETWNLQWPTSERATGALQQEGETRRKGNWLWTVSWATLMRRSVQKYFNNPTEQWSYKNTFGHLNNLHLCWSFSDMLIKICAFKAATPISPDASNYVISADSLTSIHLTHSHHMWSRLQRQLWD